MVLLITNIILILFDILSIFQVKKRQQRVLMILDSKNIDYTVIDITEPGKENEKEFMQQNSKATPSDSTVKSNPLPPQIFNEEDYCGVSMSVIIIHRKIFPQSETSI